MNTTSTSGPWLAKSSTRVTNSRTPGISRATNPPTRNTPPSTKPTTVPLITGRWLRSRNRTQPRCSGPDTKAPSAQTAASAQREPVERLVAWPAGQRIPKQRTADHEHHRDDDPPPQYHRGRFVVRHRDRADDVAQFVQKTHARRRRLCHAGLAFGARLISVSSPVRSAAATGPGTSPSRPSTGRAIDGVTARASC